MAVSKAAQEVKAGNLINASTPGYKRDTVAFASFREDLLAVRSNLPRGNHPLGNGVPMAAVSGITVNFEPGALENTGNPWDLALVGDGFFTLEGPQGERLYTRNGRFTLDVEGYVVNDQGWYLLGGNGRIMGRGMQVDGGGNIIDQGGVVSDSLLLVTFPDPTQLSRVSADHFTATEPGQAAVPQVKAGFLETSNTDLVSSLTDILMLTRTFEMGQKLIQAQDKLMDLAANQIGSLRG